MCSIVDLHGPHAEHGKFVHNNGFRLKLNRRQATTMAKWHGLQSYYESKALMSPSVAHVRYDFNFLLWNGEIRSVSSISISIIEIKYFVFRNIFYVSFLIRFWQIGSDDRDEKAKKGGGTCAPLLILQCYSVSLISARLIHLMEFQSEWINEWNRVNFICRHFDYARSIRNTC